MFFFSENSKEYWIGMEKLQILTNSQPFTLRIKMRNKSYKHFGKFLIKPDYSLEVDQYQNFDGDVNLRKIADEKGIKYIYIYIYIYIYM